jgi:hypothetical protein
MTIAPVRATSTEVAVPGQSGTVSVTVLLTPAEAAALRDGAFVCTSADRGRHQAGRRALLKVKAAISAHHPAPPIV